MRQVSKKRQAERGERLRVLAIVFERDGGCVAGPGGRFDLGTPCGWIPGRHSLEGHEIVRRAAWRAGYLVPDNVVAVCPVHHEWIGANPAKAKEAGLSMPREEWDARRDG